MFVLVCAGGIVLYTMAIWAWGAVTVLLVMRLSQDGDLPAGLEQLHPLAHDPYYCRGRKNSGDGLVGREAASELGSVVVDRPLPHVAAPGPPRGARPTTGFPSHGHVRPHVPRARLPPGHHVGA